MFVSRYQDRPSTLKVENKIEYNGRKGTVYSLNEVNITVWEDGEVTAQRKYYAKSEPASTFPNMTVNDGSINLPIEDLVVFLLARITPLELAEGIISDDEARTALIDKLAERYNEPGFTDADRRAFLTKVQQQIYAEAIGHAVERLNKAEEGRRARDDYYRWRVVETGHYRGLFEKYQATLHELREAGKIDDAEVQRRLDMNTRPDALDESIKHHRDPVVRESVGEHWHESRKYWRARLEAFFPEPSDLAARTLSEGE